MMTMAGVWVLRLVAITAVVTSSLGFVLRRREWEDDANAGLAEALPVLREERRRLEEPLDRATSFWEEPEELSEEEEEALDMQPRLNNGELLDSLLGDESNDIGEYFMPGLGYDVEEEERGEDIGEDEDDIDSDDENSISEITESPADLKELETILEPSDDEKVEKEEEESKSKKNIPIALGGPGPDRPKRADEDNEQMSNDLSLLLEKTAEKLEDEALLKSVTDAIEEEEEEENDPTPVPVSKDELKQVLSDEDDEDNEIVPEEDDDEEVLPWKRTQGEVMPALSYSPIVPLKIKRSRRNFRAADSDSADNDGSAAREYIRRFLELEDDENTNLANALNLATMAQVHRDDKLVLPEAKFIKKAIEDEQAIQELRAELSGGPNAGPRPIVAAAEAIAKREMQFEPEEEFYEEELEDEDDGEDGDEGEEELEYIPEEDEENMIQEIEEPATDLAQKLRDYLEHTTNLQRENEVDDEGPMQKGAWLDRPIEMGQEGITEDEWELNPLLRELYQRYSAGRLAKRVAQFGPEVEEYEPLEDEDEEEEEAEEEEEEPSPAEIEEMEREIENTLEGYIEARRLKDALQQEEEEIAAEEEGGLCPAVELVDGCRYAVGNLGLKLDAEAMDLCNRHQLCYTCGSVHGMTVSDCDNGYLQEANRLCEAEGNEDDCSTDAAGLFILMLQSHQFYADQNEVPSACLNPCAMDYIVGLDKK